MPQLQAAGMDATKAIPVAQGFTKHGFLGLLGLPWASGVALGAPPADWGGALQLHTDVRRDKFPASQVQSGLE